MLTLKNKSRTQVYACGHYITSMASIEVTQEQMDTWIADNPVHAQNILRDYLTVTESPEPEPAPSRADRGLDPSAVPAAEAAPAAEDDKTPLEIVQRIFPQQPLNIQQIIAAIPDVPVDGLMQNGRPRTDALEKILGRDVSARDRDIAVEIAQNAPEDG